MVDVADVKLAASDAWSLDLGVAAKAKVGVTLCKHLRIDRTMNVVANGATLAQGRVLKDERPCLLAMTLTAGLVRTR